MRWFLYACVGLAPACGPAAAFTCDDDSQCQLPGQQGQCEPNGFCSFADAACPSGRRYGAKSGAVADECVPGEDFPPPPTGGPTTTGAIPTTGVETGDESGGLDGTGTSGGRTSTSVASSSTSAPPVSSTGSVLSGCFLDEFDDKEVDAFYSTTLTAPMTMTIGDGRLAWGIAEQNEGALSQISMASFEDLSNASATLRFAAPPDPATTITTHLTIAADGILARISVEGGLVRSTTWTLAGGTVLGTSMPFLPEDDFLRLEVEGSTVRYMVSTNGIDWNTFDTSEMAWDATDLHARFATGTWELVPSPADVEFESVEICINP